jgi:hypothetical protein
MGGPCDHPAADQGLSASNLRGAKDAPGAIHNFVDDHQNRQGGTRSPDARFVISE